MTNETDDAILSAMKAKRRLLDTAIASYEASLLAGVRRIRQTLCPECDRPLNAIGTTDGAAIGGGPKPGEAVVCLRCGAAMTVDAAGNLTGFTDAQMDALTADTEAMNDLARHVARIHFLRSAN